MRLLIFVVFNCLFVISAGCDLLFGAAFGHRNLCLTVIKRHCPNRISLMSIAAVTTEGMCRWLLSTNSVRGACPCSVPFRIAALAMCGSRLEISCVAYKSDFPVFLASKVSELPAHDPVTASLTRVRARSPPTRRRVICKFKNGSTVLEVAGVFRKP